MYVLHDHHGAYYAGLAIDQPLGRRLQQHTQDQHAGRWDKFSWFGYCEMTTTDNARFSLPEPLRFDGQASLPAVIRDGEALLIMVLNTVNRAKMHLQEGWEWQQVATQQWPGYARRIGCT